MATCIRCDKCGKIMEEIPVGKEEARKVVRIETQSIFTSKPGDKGRITSSRSIHKDLCSDCCWSLQMAILEFMHPSKENEKS